MPDSTVHAASGRAPEARGSVPDLDARAARLGDEIGHVEGDGLEFRHLGRCRPGLEGEREIVVAGDAKEGVGGDLARRALARHRERDHAGRRGEWTAQVVAVDGDARRLAPERHRQIRHVTAGPRGLVREHVHASGEVLAGLGGQDRVRHHGVVGHALAHDLDHDEPAPGVARTRLDVVQERHRRRLHARLDDHRGVVGREDPVRKPRVFVVLASVDEGRGEVGPHVRERRAIPSVGSTSFESGLTRMELPVPACTCT